MTADVIGLHGVPVPDVDGKVNQEIVDLLEGLLADARAGWIHVFAFGAMTTTGQVRSNWIGASTANGMQMAGLIAHLSHELHVRINAEGFDGGV